MEEKNVISENLKKKADKLESMATVVVLFLALFGIFGSFIYAMAMHDEIAIIIAVVNVFISSFAMYIVNVVFSSKAAFYRNQAEILNTLKEIQKKG